MRDECKGSRVELEANPPGAPLSARARFHLDSCEACRISLRENEGLNRLLAGLERVEAPADFEFRLRARLASSSADHRRAAALGFRRAIAFAAVVLLVSSAAFAFFLSDDSERAGVTNSVAEVKLPSEVSNGNSKAETREPVGYDETVIASRSSEAREEVVERASHRPSLQPEHAVARRAGGRQARSASKATSRMEAETFEQRTASVISLASGREGAGTRRELRRAAGADAPVETLRVVLRDESGLTRTVPIRSVSFGAQDPFVSGRNVKRASLKDEESVW